MIRMALLIIILFHLSLIHTHSLDLASPPTRS